MFSLFLLNGCGPSLKQTMATWEGNTMSDVIMLGEAQTVLQK